MTKNTASTDIPVKTMRIPQEVWDDLGESCARIGSNRTEQMLLWANWFNRKPGSRAPKRPDMPTAGSSQ